MRTGIVTRFFAAVIATLAIMSVASAQAPVGPGCSTCGKAEKSSHTGTRGAVHNFFSSAFIGSGTAMPIGCSCYSADKTFIFGTCRQFFNPGKVCSDGGYFARPHCAMPIYGPGGVGQPANNCAGPFSYLNR